MKITSRLTKDFIELRVDKVEETIWKSSKVEIAEMIENLLEIIDDIEKLEDNY